MVPDPIISHNWQIPITCSKMQKALSVYWNVKYCPVKSKQSCAIINGNSMH